jgi:hypothetical protein
MPGGTILHPKPKIPLDLFARWLDVERNLLDITTEKIYFFPYKEHVASMLNINNTFITVNHDIEAPNECPICLNTLTNPQCTITLPCCKQRMHPWCLYEGITNGMHGCPMCRKNICKITATMSCVDCLKWYFSRDLTDSLQHTNDFFTYMKTDPTSFTSEYMVNYCSMQYMAITACLERLTVSNIDTYNAYIEIFEKSDIHSFVTSHCTPRMKEVSDALRDPTRMIHQKIGALSYPLII